MGSRARVSNRKSTILEISSFSRVLERLEEPAFLADANGQILYANPAFRDAFGNDKQRVLRRELKHLSQVSGLKRSASEFSSLVTDAVQHCERPGSYRKRNVFLPLFSVSAIHNAARKVQGYLAIRGNGSGGHGALEELLQRNKELTMLNAISSEISRTLSMEKVFKVVLESVRKTFGADDGLLFILDREKQELRCVSACGSICRHKRELDLLRTVKVGKGITGRVAKNGKPALVSDVLKEAGINRPRVIRRLGIRSNVSVPLKCHGRVLGVLNLGYLRRREFSREDELFLAAVGNVVGVAIEHIEHDRRIKDLMARYRALIDKASDGVLIADKTGCYVEANQMICKMLGYSRSEIVGKSVGTFVAEYPKRKVRQNFFRLMQQGYIRAQRNMRRKDGTIVSVEVTANRIQIGNEYFSQAIYRDLTERLKTEQEIRRCNRELTILNSVSEIVNRSLDLTKILNTALEKICEGLSVEAASLFAMDEEGKRVHLKASRGVSARLRGSISQFRVGDGFTGRVAKTGKSVIVNAESPEGNSITHAALREGHKAFVSVPIKSPTRVLGVLEAASRKPRKFTWADVGLLTAIGYEIGTAIEKVRLFEAVKSEKEKLNSILSAIDEGVQILDQDYTIQYQNRWSQQRIGNVQGQKCYRVYHGRSKPCQSCPVVQAVRQGKIVRREGRGKDGRVYEVVTVPMHGNGQSPVAIEITRDITERTQAEEALRESEEKYRNVVERANDGIAIFQDTLFVYANKRLAEMFGSSVKDLIGTSFTDCLWPEEIPRVLDSYKRRMAGEDLPNVYESVGKHKDGYKIHIEINAGVVTYQGKPANLAIVRDITERKRAEKALEAERQRLFSLLDALPAYVYLQAPDHSIRFANRYFREHFGDPAGRLCYEVFQKRTEPCEVCPTFRVFESKESREWEWTSVFNGRTYNVCDYLFTDIDGSPLALEMGIDITERKRAEEALQASKQLLERTLHSLRDAVFIIDANTLTIVDCNPAASEIFGYSRDEMLGETTTFLLVAPSKLEEFRKHLYPAVERSGFLSQLEFAMKRKDGTIFPTEHSVVPLDDERGKRIGWVSVVRDITKRKQAEEALRRHERELRVIAENVPALLSYIDTEGRYRFVNKQYEEWFGISREEIIGKHYREILGEASYEVIQDRVEAALAGQRVRFEDAIPYAYGGTRWVIADYVPDTDDQGKVKGFFALVTDVTEHKRTEEALKESLERLNLAARASKEGLWDWNIVTNEVYQSPRFKELLGYEDRELESSFEAWKSRLHPEDECRVMKAVHNHLERGTPYDIEYRLRTKMGDYRWFKAHGIAIKNEEGKATRMAGTIRDITEARRNEERMRHLERLAMVGQVAARVAHEINNPLASLSLDLERLRDRFEPRGEPARIVQRMTDVMGRISNTVEGLLDLAKHRPLEKRAVDINAILDEDVSVMRQQFQAEGKKIVSHYDRNIPHVSVDINQIRQVFINLMINALEALQHGGCLTIATKYLPARKQVHITFKDEGVGVPAHIRSRIFEPFFSTKSDGVGLGLAISQGIVISHGGSIEVEDHPHKGAVFTVILPVSTFLSQDDV